MGAGASASLTQEEVKLLPQYTILGGDAKFEELKEADGTITLSKVEDPYLKYGGAYMGDPKDTKDYPEGVWTLPPTYRLKEQDRAKYAAIGESDRFTLKFVKQ